MLLGTYLVFREHYLWGSLSLGFGLGTHHLILFAVLILVVYSFYMLRNVKKLLLICMAGIILGVSTYIQCVIGSVPPFETANGLGSIFSQSTGSSSMIGQIPLLGLPIRLGEFGAVMLTGPFLALPLVLLKFRKTKEEIVLLAICLSVTIYYLTSFPPQWVTYPVAAIAFLAPLVGFAVSGLRYRVYPVALLLVLLSFLGLNILTYDLGTTLEEDSSARQLYEELDILPDGSIVYTHTWGHPRGVVYYYCMENDWRITLVSQGGILYNGWWYRDELKRRGVTVPTYEAVLTNYRGKWIWTYPDFSRFNLVTLLADSNPDREVYIANLKTIPEEDSQGRIVFTLEPVSYLGDGLYHIPGGRANTDRILRVQSVDESTGDKQAFLVDSFTRSERWKYGIS